MSREKQRELKTKAANKAANAVEAMDLETLFGEELYESQYHEGNWVEEILDNLQKSIVKKIRTMK